ncbi:MAG: hypothetical protein Q7T82_20080 [Armatimonadota bacterium]|nr:hypothetical protein [Armatimonadota bacterium]
MRIRRTLALFLPVVLIVLPAVAGYSAITVKREFTLPTFQGYPYRPRVTGDWVIANQNSEKNNNSACQAVNVYNLVTGEATCALEGKAFWPEAGGNCAVWTVDPPSNIGAFLAQSGNVTPDCGKSNLVILDLAASRYYTPALRTRSAYQYDVWGDYVVWTGRGGDAPVCFANVKTGKQQTQITQGRMQRYQPTICGNLIIWLEDDDASNQQPNSVPLQLRAYDIATGRHINIPQDANVRHNSPCTDGKTIVWWQSKPNVVMGYDVKTGKTSKIADGYFPDIDNGVVVYMKHDSKVYGKDLKSGQEFLISKGISNQGPSFCGKWVVWTASSLDNKIHCAELSGIGSK